MSTPVSVSQINKLLSLLGNPSSEKFQYLLANGDLLKSMVDADLTRVDRSAFGTVLTPVPAPPTWTPVSQYVKKIKKWNKQRGWGFTRSEIDTFASGLVDHFDPLHPTGISLWLGRDLSYNWEEVMACLKLEVEALGERFTRDVNANRASFYLGSEQGSQRKLTVALLDLRTYWNPTDGVVPDEDRKIEKRLPGLEVFWLMALNPQVFVKIA